MSDELSADQRRAYELMKSEKSIYQSQLWKRLDISSKKASRIVSTLRDKGIIEREEAVYNGNNTYLLKPSQEELDYSLLMSNGLISPFVGAEDEVDPVSSDAFTQWILELAHE